ncbi:hypothetical protein [Bacillus sp. S/N-304-OC-R1]|uniref:hypothetical protein n=1 Tax=Bacillus sp. S/N-304-OC-R1 TaxID=2758034 RepID=UPI001C8DCBAC|nr:hypothetical protein [Bacillus sp. S/N-304-OC-R1]MBY0122753.1 hypothetical protein [Bacillus sp. S/N-304-OC-R1]
MKEKIIDMVDENAKLQLEEAIRGMTFTKNFRSPSAEEWYIFIPGFKDPVTGGAPGKAIIHYNLYDTKQIFINTTIIWDDPALQKGEAYQLVYAISDEIVNRLVGYADTLLSVHSGENSYNAEYKEN